MKGAVSTENCHQSHSYCIWWRRVGGPDRFQHWVLADSIDDAVSRSRSCPCSLVAGYCRSQLARSLGLSRPNRKLATACWSNRAPISAL
jgi:hypothetical protein